MRVLFLFLILSVAIPTIAQETNQPQAKIEYDTIQVNEFHVKLLAEISDHVNELQRMANLLASAKINLYREELQKDYADDMTKIMLIVTAYIDPESYSGLTENNKILKKK
jgi:hypothetical protein